MNHQLWNRVTVRVIALMFVMAGAAACDRHRDGASLGASSGSAPLPASADASGDPPGTTPVAPDTSNLSKRDEQTGPREGDNHSYSSVSPSNPQKAQNVDPQQTTDRTDLNKTEGQPK